MAFQAQGLRRMVACSGLQLRAGLSDWPISTLQGPQGCLNSAADNQRSQLYLAGGVWEHQHLHVFSSRIPQLFIRPQPCVCS